MGEEMHKRIIVTLICTLTLLSVSSGQTSDDINMDKKNPKLESILTQMINSEDPRLFARTHGISLENSNIRVIVEMSGEKAMLPDYLIEENRQNNNVQVMVPIEKISTLSQEPDVMFIRLPSKPLVDTVNPTPADQTPVPKSGFNSALLMVFSIILILLIKKKGDVILVKK